MLKQIDAQHVLATASALPDTPQRSALVPRVDASGLPVAFDQLTDRDIPDRVWCGWIPRDGSKRMIRRALRAEERSAIAHRAAELRPVMAPFVRPADDDVVAGALFDMLGSFPSMRDRGADALGKVESMLHALAHAELPAWAIKQGCMSIRTDGYEVATEDGRHIERHWPPSDAEVVRTIRQVIAQRGRALAHAEALLAAAVEQPEPPRPTWAEIKAQLEKVALPPLPPTNAPGYMERVLADLAERRARKQPTEQPDA